MDITSDIKATSIPVPKLVVVSTYDKYQGTTPSNIFWGVSDKQER